ncbi:NADH dehydrogenase [ubiquinone] 1 alpha subcomplex subunit 8-B [Glycine max]|nr:NADH dehydrogenase [ubiquinone] 1 alpha subcomplex subunit 8-B [Glycine max]
MSPSVLCSPRFTFTSLPNTTLIALFSLPSSQRPQITAIQDASGNPIPTSAVLMASSKHIGIRCHSENLEFLKCKKKDQNPENCLDKGRDVTRCVLGLLKDLHQKCTKEMDDYVGCMYYHTNEFDLCRKEQQAFEKKCSLE